MTSGTSPERTDRELSFRLSRAGVNIITEEFVTLAMAAHGPSLDNGMRRARQVGAAYSEGIAALGNDFCVEFQPDGLKWQFLVATQEYLFELSHVNRWAIYRCGRRTLELVSLDGGPVPDMPLPHLRAVAVDVKIRLGDYLRYYQIPLPENSEFQ
jgi:hypothetical protein